MARMRRRDAVAVATAAALALSTSTTNAFITCPSRGGLRAKAPRTLAVRQLNMVGGGPRGRSSAGLSIEGADGSTAVLTAAASRSPIQAAPAQSIDEYAQDEMVDGASDGMGIGADDGMDDYRGFTVSQDEMGALQYQRSETMQRKNKLIFSGVIAASILAGAWATVSSALKRQEALVEAYADEITYHIGDLREMELCHKEYKSKIGPKLYRESMFKQAMVAVGQKRSMTLESVRSVKHLIKLFGFKTTKAVKLLVAAARTTEQSQSNVRSKLYFLGTLLSMNDDKATAALEPLKKNVLSSFRGDSDGETMLKVRMDGMAESALKSAIEAVREDEVLESGWEELGISDDRASEIASSLVDDEDTPNNALDFYKTGGGPTNDEESDPDAAAMLKQLEDKMEEMKNEPQDEKEPEAEGTAKSYECQVCGYKMFVAKGREFKFFGDGFKCPECGAGKNKFVEADMDD